MRGPTVRVGTLGATLLVVLVSGPGLAAGQSASRPPAGELARARQAIAAMEGVLERAVVTGADSLNRRVRALAPQDPPLLLAGDVEVRGFRLDGFGFFFDVEVPMLRQSVAWSLRTRLDQQGASLNVALDQLRSYVRAASDAGTRQSLEQALQRLERQVRPDPAAGAPPAAPPGESTDWLKDPNAAYTAAVKDALVDAMVQQSAQLEVGPDEWLVVAARDTVVRTRVPGEFRSTVTLRVKGSDLAALRAGRVAPEDARRRVEIREQ